MVLDKQLNENKNLGVLLKSMFPPDKWNEVKQMMRVSSDWYRNKEVQVKSEAVDKKGWKEWNELEQNMRRELIEAYKYEDYSSMSVFVKTRKEFGRFPDPLWNLTREEETSKDGKAGLN